MQYNKRLWISVMEGVGSLLLLAGTLFIRALWSFFDEQAIDREAFFHTVGLGMVGLSIALLLAAFASRFFMQASDRNLQTAERILMGTGLLSIIAGSFYLPWVPWYMLGNETEQEITQWGRWSVWGGLAAYWGSILLARVSLAWKPYLLFTGGVGVFLIGLAQVLPIYMYIFFWGSPIAETAIENPTVAGLLPMLPHMLLGALCLYCLVAIGGALWKRSSQIRLTKKQWGVIACALLAIGAVWFGYDVYQDQTWVKVTHPANGAVDVPLRTSVRVEWHGRRDNGGINVYYADDPAKSYIPARSGFSQEGMIYSPERPFLPGKKIIVEVESGSRKHSFSFTTALQ